MIAIKHLLITCPRENVQLYSLTLKEGKIRGAALLESFFCFLCASTNSISTVVFYFIF
jgi:hypothetical protein